MTLIKDIYLSITNIRLFPLFCFGLLFFINSSPSISQEYGDKSYYLVDSLNVEGLDERDKSVIQEKLEIYHSTKSDSLKIICLIEIAEGILSPRWEDYNKLIYEHSKRAIRLNLGKTEEQKNFYKSSLGNSLNNMGYAANNRSNGYLAVDYYMEAVRIFEEVGDSTGMAIAYINSAGAYHNIGEIELSNEMDRKGLAIGEAIHDTRIICYGYKNLAMKLMMNDFLEEALENGLTALKYARLTPDGKIFESSALLGVAQIYQRLDNHELATKYFKESLDLSARLASHDDHADGLIAYSEFLKDIIFEDIANKKDVTNLVDSAEVIIFEAIKLCRLTDAKNSLIRSYVNLGSIYNKTNDLKKSIIYLDSAYYLSKELKNIPKIKTSAWSRYRVLYKLGRYKESVEVLKDWIDADEQMRNAESLEMATTNKFRLEYKIKMTKDSLRHENEQALAKKEIVLQKVQIEADNRQKWFLYSGLTLVLVFSYILFRKFKSENIQKKLIEEQKHEIEEVHQEIQSSIKYAQGLQNAILPPVSSIKASLNNAFVLFQPKDVVSGDFYWFDKKGDEIYIAVADCTGHGVPGAMVSIVCSNALHRSLNEFDLSEPSDILNQSRDLVIDTFAKSGDNVKDGMDICLCKLNLKTNELTFSGANNPLWIKRAGVSEMEELKANKQPVGLYEGMKPFNSEKTILNNGDHLFLFTDGYADQFGGEKGKKMKYKPFKELLMKNSDLPAEEQCQELGKYFQDWRGSHEQIDDVCIIGFKV